LRCRAGGRSRRVRARRRTAARGRWRCRRAGRRRRRSAPQGSGRAYGSVASMAYGIGHPGGPQGLDWIIYHRRAVQVSGPPRRPEGAGALRRPPLYTVPRRWCSALLELQRVGAEGTGLVRVRDDRVAARGGQREDDLRVGVAVGGVVVLRDALAAGAEQREVGVEGGARHRDDDAVAGGTLERVLVVLRPVVERAVGVAELAVD